VKVKHLEDMFKRDRKVYLRNLAKTSGMIRIEPVDPEIMLSRYLTYSIEMNDFMFAAGMIPVKIHNVWSYDSFEIRVGVKTDFRFRLLEEPADK
jgi:hypothetical protein